jgi:hypothetical protein
VLQQCVRPGYLTDGMRAPIVAGLDDEVVAVAKGGGAQEDNAAYADSDVEVIEAENGATYPLPTYRK